MADHAAWSIPWRTEYYEGIWTRSPLSLKVDTMCSPITLEMTDGSYAFLHEAALTDYPAQNLYMADGLLRTYLTPWMDSTTHVMPEKAYLSLPFRSPWRFIILTRDLPSLVASRIMLNLNEPCRLEDTSWIRPMKFIGIWWGMHMKSMTWEQGPIHGATTANMSRYLQFAHDHNIQAVLAEGWNLGWEDWKHFSFTEPYPDWDMDRLAHLADSLGVQIVGHNETGGNAADYEDQLTDAYVANTDAVIAMAQNATTTDGRPAAFCAAVYTQTTDVETEVNGIMTYDREIIKMNEQRVHEVNQRLVNIYGEWTPDPSAINDIQLRVCLPGETEWKEYTSGSFKVTKKAEAAGGNQP
jgi:hypothetical protein